MEFIIVDGPDGERIVEQFEAWTIADLLAMELLDAATAAELMEPLQPELAQAA